jgi:leucyl-tRNA synthetase
MGADTARLFVMFASPPEQTLEWSDSGVDGANRFLRRVWAFCHKQAENLKTGIAAAAGDHGAAEGSPFQWGDARATSKDLRREIHSLLKLADYDYQRIQYNTVVSTCMKMLNALESAELDDTPCARQALAETVSILIRVLYPVVPHITWRIWNDLGYAKVYGDLLDAPWPDVDPAALIADEIELMLQVNGKLRGSVTVPNGASKDQIEQTALSHEASVRFLEGRPAKRVIVVPGKLVNIVG